MQDFYIRKDEQIIFTSDVCQQFDSFVNKFPEKNRLSAILPILTLSQKLNLGYLNEDIKWQLSWTKNNQRNKSL